MAKPNKLSLDTLFGGCEENSIEGNRLVMVETALIDPHPEHHFKPFDKQRNRGLLESIREYGVMQPVILQPKADGRYTMLAGYKRLHCNNLAGHQKILALLKEDISESVAKAMITHTNTRQTGLSGLLTSELAFALKLELECFVELRKQLRGKGIVSGKIELDGKVSEFGHLEKSRDALAKTYGMKPTDVQRLLQITTLIPELLELVDTKKIALGAAVPLAALEPVMQQEIFRLFTAGHRVDIAKAEALREAAKTGTLTVEQVTTIVTGSPTSQPSPIKPVKIQALTIQRYFTRGESPKEIQSTIEKALELYFRQEGMNGVGDILAPRLIAEIGDVRRFHSGSALIAFAGIDSPPFQSGSFTGTRRKISKRGSSLLRKTGYEVMKCLKTVKPAQDNAVYLYMLKKESEGKPKKVAKIAALNKFLRIYYARASEVYAS